MSKTRKKRSSFKCMIFPKKGVSAVIAVVIMIALAVALIAVVWMVVQNLVRDELEGAGSCFDIFEKLTINKAYTCYEIRGGTDNRFRFSINRGDIDVDSILVSISSEAATKSYNIPLSTTGLSSYPDPLSGVILPEKNSGLTYSTTQFPTKPDSIKIAPIVNEKQCEVSDFLSEIENCIPSPK